MPDKVCTKMSFSILTQMPYIRALMPYMFFYSYRNLANVFNVLLFFQSQLRCRSISMHGLHVLLYYRNLARSYGYDTLKKRRTRIHAYVHLWYATKTLTDLYQPPKRLPTSNTLTCLPYAYLLTCLPHFPWPQTLTCLPAYHMPCGHRPQ